jgi:hypothetical protein
MIGGAFMSSARNAVIGAALIAAVAAGGVAIGGVPGQDGLIHACYKKKNGALRVTSDGKCRKREQPLQFNQTGQQGEVGQQGGDGATGRSALDTLRSGETIRGTWALAGDATSSGEVTGVTFPVPAAQPVDSQHVVFAGNDSVVGDGCTGSAAAPVAGPGFVCIYAATASGTSGAAGLGALGTTTDPYATGDGSPYGFAMYVAGGAGWVAVGTWAYTAP